VCVVERKSWNGQRRSRGCEGGVIAGGPSMRQLRSDGKLATGKEYHRNGPGLRQTDRVLGLTRRMVSLREIWGITGGEEIQVQGTWCLLRALFFFSLSFFLFFFSLPITLSLFSFSFLHPPLIFLFYLLSIVFILFYFFYSNYFIFPLGGICDRRLGSLTQFGGLLDPRRGLRPEGTKPFSSKPT